MKRTLLLALLATSPAMAQINAGTITPTAEKPFVVTKVTTMSMPWRIAFLPDGRMLVTEKVGRVRNCKIGACRLEEEMEWISRYRQVWDARFEALDRVIEQLKSRDNPDVRKKRK